jgi:signal transduction histidine kinase
VETSDATLVTATDRVVVADPDRLQRLLENLVRNAVEHGGDDVTVVVGGLDDGFYVEDDGRGIPEADRRTVLESGYSTANDGTGVGLHIVDRMADVHDWALRVTESDDGGARFEITGVEFVSG